MVLTRQELAQQELAQQPQPVPAQQPLVQQALAQQAPARQVPARRPTSPPGALPREISLPAARRIAVAAQQLAEHPDSRPRVINRGHLRRTVERAGLLQIDSVNVLARAHRLPVFARLGNYSVEALESEVWTSKPRQRTLVETWAHEASIVPVRLYPLLRWRGRHWSVKAAEQIAEKHPSLLADVTALVREGGPASAGQIEKALAGGQKGKAGWWEWSETKRACEALFVGGVLGTAYRRGFERHYDLVERVLPPAVLAMPIPDPADAKRTLIEISARAHGIGTAADLADYFRMPTADAKSALADLVEHGVVEQVRVTGWRDVAYLHAEARQPRKVHGQALLCPFDPLIWERTRTERLFGTRYRISIYTPKEQREHGYYVLPLLVGDALSGRFDLKADRSGGRLLVQASWLEPGTEAAATARAAAEELRRMANWLELDGVTVMPRGDFWRETQAALRGAV